MSIEYRASQGIELRAVEGKPGTLTGYAAVFNKRSLDLGGFVEVVKPGAFKRSLAEGPDVLALAYHDPSKPLARRSAGTLIIEEDSTGLRVDIALADTTLARDVAADVRAGNVAGMSFGFSTKKDSWTRGLSGEPTLRELLDVELHEVSAVTWPAYPDTSVAMRTLRQFGPDTETAQRLNAMRIRLHTLPL